MTNREIRTKMKKALETRWCGVPGTCGAGTERVRCPSLKVMCAYINTSFLGKHFTANLDQTFGVYNDRHIAGTRFRDPGTKEYTGNVLFVKDKTGKVVFQHDSTDTYRDNHEVADWILDQEKEVRYAQRKNILRS